MVQNGGKITHRLAKWLDEWKMAFSGVVLATREWRFLLTFCLTFVIFGTILSLLSGSSSALSLFGASDFGGKVQIIWDSFLTLFGVGMSFLDWLLIFCITILQSVLIGLVVLVWQKRRKSQHTNSNNVQDAGLVAGLALLGTGCPTCGTTLLAPVIGAFVSSGSYMLAGVISGLLTAAAIILALFALKRVGKDAYAMIISERFMHKHRQKKENTDGE